MVQFLISAVLIVWCILLAIKWTQLFLTDLDNATAEICSMTMLWWIALIIYSQMY